MSVDVSLRSKKRITVYQSVKSTLGQISRQAQFKKYSTLGSAIKNLGLFSKSSGDFRIEKMDFYSSLGRSTPGVLLPRLPQRSLVSILKSIGIFEKRPIFLIALPTVQCTGIVSKMYHLCQSSQKVKEATTLLMSDEYRCFKDNC